MLWRGGQKALLNLIKMQRLRGFTLIELISVIVILGILATTATGVFTSKRSFEASVVKNQLLSSLRLTQQLALSRQNLSTSEPVTLAISQTSDTWVFSSWDSDPSGAGNTPFAVTDVERSNTSLRFSTSDFASACSDLSSSTSYDIEFDGNGNLLNANQLRICVVGDQSKQICLSGLGFAYEGDSCL